jgi:hypothetical protein
MRYQNNPILRDYLSRGGTAAQAEYLAHPCFELDDAAFAAAFSTIRRQHPSLDVEHAEARAAFRLLTSGAPPNVARPLPSRWKRAHKMAKRGAARAWPWIKIAWAIAVLSLLLAGRAHGQEPEGVGAKKHGPQAALTVIPLTDSEKLRMRNLQVEQDGYIIQLQKLQLQENQTQKLIDDLNKKINQAAADIAAADKIDTNALILDLPKLAWVTKSDGGSK